MSGSIVKWLEKCLVSRRNGRGRLVAAVKFSVIEAGRGGELWWRQSTRSGIDWRGSRRITTHLSL